MTEQHAKLIAYRHHLGARGVVNPIWTVQAAHFAGLTLAEALALLEKESGLGHNVFGHDPTTSIPSRWKGGKVTRWRYFWYKRRRPSKGMQGVGPCQLTWWSTQDEADHRGGCWHPYHNMEVGFQNLAGLISSHGPQNGAAIYNGSGPDAQAYGRDYMVKKAKWEAILAKD